MKNTVEEKMLQAIHLLEEHSNAQYFLVERACDGHFDIIQVDREHHASYLPWALSRAIEEAETTYKIKQIIYLFLWLFYDKKSADLAKQLLHDKKTEGDNVEIKSVFEF